MARFFVSADITKASTVALDKKESRHALKVLRLKVGDVVDLFDGTGHAARGVVAGERGGQLLVSVDVSGAAAFADSVSEVPMDLAMALIKPEPMELAVQKASELGVRSILPIVSERTVVKLSAERRAGKAERWRKIALESCKQCGRKSPPVIAEIESFETLTRRIPSYGAALIAALSGKTVPMAEALGPEKPSSLLVMIGPEGDFTAQETERALKAGARAVSLGPLVLRAETAALYALSAAGFYYREVIHAIQN